MCTSDLVRNQQSFAVPIMEARKGLSPNLFTFSHIWFWWTVKLGNSKYR